MNERIRELMEQVVRIEIDPDSNCETIYTCGPEELEAFAELIVRECMEVVGDCSVEYATRPQIIEEIKEHFGVEE